MTCTKKQLVRRFLILVCMFLVLIGGYGCSGENPEKLFQQGTDAMETGKLDEAVIWFKKALQESPEMAIAHYKLGQIYHQNGDVKQAYGHLSRAVQQDPKLKDAGKELALLLIENRVLVKAAEVCRQYLTENGDDEEIYLILGNSLAYTEKLDEAIEVMQEARSKYPESTSVQLNLSRMLVARGDIDEGRALVESLAQANPDDVSLQMAMAQVYQIIERYDLAVMALEQIKKDFPESPLPILSLAELSLKKNQLDQAQGILHDAEHAGISDSRIFRSNAMIYHRQGDSFNALKYFEKAVEVSDEEQIQANRLVLVDYHTFLKNYKEAQEILETIIAEDDSKKALKSKVVELFLAQGAVEQARESVESLLKEDSSDARGHFLKGLMMMQEKDVAEARDEFSKAKELAPNVAENQFLYGLTFMGESQNISITEISEALKKNPNMLKARMALAKLFVQKGDFQKSLDELDKIIAKRPNDSQVRDLRISVLLKMKNPDAALADAQLLVEEQPEDVWHVFRLAEIYFFKKEYDRALPLYSQIQKDKPDSVRVLNRIAGIHMLKKEHEKAMKTVDTFLAKYPEKSQATIVKAKIYLAQGDLALAEQILLPEAEKGEDITPVLMLAELYKLQGENEKALQFYQKALEFSPDNIKIMMQLAAFQLKSGDNPGAIENYEKVLQVKSDFLPAMNNLAFLYGEEGKNLDRALELANTVARELPDNPDAADTLGWIYVMKKAYSQAEPYLQMALSAKAEHPTFTYHMGILRYGQKQYREAEELLRAAIQKGIHGNELVAANEVLAKIEETAVKLQRAVSEKDSGNVSQATLLYEEILNKEGFNGVAAADLAILYAEQGTKKTRAMELAQKAYDSQPGNAQIADALGWVYYQQGSLLMAKQYLEKAIENDGDYALARIHLETVLEKEKEE